MAKTKGPAEVYQLKITLRDIEPPVWRQVQDLLDDELSRLPDVVRVPLVLCELEGLTIKGGYIDCCQGAGILIEDANLTINGCTISDNTHTAVAGGSIVMRLR